MIDARIAALRAEIEASGEDTSRKAWLLHEVAFALETVEGLEGNAAVRDYLGSFNADATFEPPLHALTRIFERRGAVTNLSRLYDAASKNAADPRSRVLAAIDLSGLEAAIGRDESASTRIDALFADGSDDPDLALAMERRALRDGDAERAARAIERRIPHVKDLALASTLWIDVAELRVRSGDFDGAYEAIESARALSKDTDESPALATLERIAASQHDDERRADARLALAEAVIAAVARGRGPLLHGPSWTDAESAKSAIAGALLDAARVFLPFAPAKALTALDRALSYAPGSAVLTVFAFVAAERAEDGDRATALASTLLTLEGGSPVAAAFALRAARGLSGEAKQTALAKANELAMGAPSVLAASEEDARERGDVALRLALLDAAAERAEPAAKYEALLRAACIAAAIGAEEADVVARFERAAEAAPDEDGALRELYVRARTRGDAAATLAALTRLVPKLDDPLERSAALLEALARAALELEDSALVHRWAERALEDTAATWAPSVVRYVASLENDFPLVARAHEKLADRASDDITRGAHLAAAARAYVAAGDKTQAERVARSALDSVPGDGFVLALLEELLRARGEPQELVALLRKGAEGRAAGPAAERALLLAGAAAEAGGDTRLAAESYEQAADRNPQSQSPLWALRRLGEATSAPDVELRALEALAQQASPSRARASLDLALHYDLVSQRPELAESTLSAFVADEDVGLDASLWLALLTGRNVDERARLSGLLALGKKAPSTELGRAALLAALTDRLDVPAAEQLAKAQKRGVGEAYVRWRTAMLASIPEERAAALDALGQAVGQELGAEIRWASVRARAIAGDRTVWDDATLIADAFGTEGIEGLAAIAADEAMTPQDDPEAHAHALEARLSSTALALRPSVEGAMARALTAAGRTKDALTKLHTLLEARPKDYAAWNALRVAARAENAFEDVVKACEVLARVSADEHRAALLEEAGQAALAGLSDDARAQKLFRAALDADPRATVAYARLHALLTKQNDQKALLALVTDRVSVTDEKENRARLHYERARLYRSLGERDDALIAVEDVLAEDANHAAAIALAAEVEVSRERFADAVEHLRRLAHANVPLAQKRVAHLGAADFLSRKLNDYPAALRELRAVEKLAGADTALALRMADVAEQGDLFRESVEALETAARLSSGEEKATAFRRAGQISWRYLNDPSRARTLFEHALDASPTDEEAAAALAKLVVEPTERNAIIDGFEHAVRLRWRPTDVDVVAIRKLQHAADWRNAKDLGHLALSALVTLGAATVDEQTWDDENTAIVRRVRPNPAIVNDIVKRLRAPGADHAALEDLASALFETLIELDTLEPSKHGVGRADLVSPKSNDPVRAQLAEIASAYGVQVVDHYASARDPENVLGLPKPNGIVFIAGRMLAPPLEGRVRFRAGFDVMTTRMKTYSLTHKPAEHGAAILIAAREAAEAPLANVPDALRPGVAEWSRLLGKTMGRRVRKHVHELASKLPNDANAYVTFVAALRRTAMRAGLLAAGDLRASLETVMGHAPTIDTVRRSPDAIDLVHFHLSPTSLALRRELGIAS